MSNLTTPSELLTVGDWVRFGTSRFAHAQLHFGHGTDNAADEAHALVMHTLGLSFSPPAYVYAAALTAAERTALGELIHRRVSERLPLPYLLGSAWFCGLEFQVDERVLIPRSPIGELIEARFEPWAVVPPGGRVLDMCTGSGCIAIACAAWLDDVSVDAVDLDAGALAVARANVAQHQMQHQVRVLESDLYAALDGQRYDLIVANPPYVPSSSMAKLPAEYAHEPSFALLAADDGLQLVATLLRDAHRHLTDDGVLLMEVGESAEAFAQRYPELPVMWCEFERGGDGVFAIDARALRDASLNP
ncbi:MAG: 50S ribosomal protein L3 N(5)-glutamine methyltransferase [Gammaproteobacteria bacterium]